MEDATQQGAILERLESYLAPEESSEHEKKHDTTEDSIDESKQQVPEETETESLEGDAPEADATDEIEESQIELPDLAAVLGLEPDRLDVDESGNLLVRTKIDGKDGIAKFTDLIKSYQLEGHLNKQNMEVSEQRKALETKLAEIESQSQAKIQQLDDLANIAWGDLNAQYQSIDWAQLRVEDPAEFAAKSQEFQQRNAQIQSMFAQLQQQRTSQTQERNQTTLKNEGEKLLRAIPEWSDAGVAEKDRAAIRKFAGSVGFSSDEVNTLSDHRAVVVLRKAMLYDQLQQTKPEVTKKVRKAPKLVRPGQATSKADRNAESLKTLKSTIKKSGGKDGVAAYLLATGKV